MKPKVFSVRRYSSKNPGTSSKIANKIPITG